MGVINSPDFTEKTMMKINNFLINRINLRFNKEISCYLNISKSTSFSLVGNKAVWTKGKLPPEYHIRFEDWLKEQQIEIDVDFVCFDFSEEENDDCFSVQLNTISIQPFKNKIFLQELGKFFIERGFYIVPLT